MKHRLFIFSLFFLYLLVLTTIMLLEGENITFSRYILVLLLGALLVKRARNFVLDWAPFLFILISYDFLRGFTNLLSDQVHYQELIDLEARLFNNIPNLVLQQQFFHPNHLAWYDYLATLLYSLHFVLPASFAFLLWLYKKAYFREFVTGITLLCYSAWITYLLFPAAPPWLSSQLGYLPHVHKIMFYTLQSVVGPLDLPTLYHNLNPNPVACLPSMHAAWPFLILLFALRYFKTKALIFIPYVLAIWFSIVYLGEHYIIDIIAGMFYALFFFLFSVYIMHRINWYKVFNLTLYKYFPFSLIFKTKPH